MTRLILSLSLLTFLSACGGLRDSRVNPFNWFGGDEEEIVIAATVVDPRGLVDQVLSLKIDRLPGGALISVVGLPQTQGFYAGDLVALNGGFPDKGVLSYEFRALPPVFQNASGTPRSREILVGQFISDQSLIGVRRITVIGQSNRRTVRR